MKIHRIAVVVTAILCFGCSKPEPTTSDTEDAPPPEKKLTPASGTSIGDTIEGMAGMTQAKQGRKAAEKIRAISRERDDDLNEVLGE